MEIQPGDLIYTGARVWVVSAVYLNNEEKAVAGDVGRVALRYPEDRAPLERAFMQIADVAPERMYRQVHPES